MRLNEDYFDSIHADDFDNENDITVEKTESFPMDVLQWYKENKRYNAMFVVSKNFYSEIFKDVEEGSFVYFVHSFYGDAVEEELAATCEYGKAVTACVARDKIVGCQFHPEKSGEVGLSILRAFCSL